MTRPIGLAALTVLELPHHEQVSVAAQAGYSHVGLRLRPVTGQPYLFPVDLRQIKARLADTDMKFLDVQVFRLAADTNQYQFEPVMAMAGEVGAGHLLLRR